MKTPREILIQRHQAATPKLDAIRQSTVAAVYDRRSVLWQTFVPGILQAIWRELILPSRRIWAGLAAVWLLLFVVNFSMQDRSQLTMAKASTPAEMAATVHQEQELLAQLLGPDEPVAAEPQKKYVPRPSSWRQMEVLMT
jgi:hypothetical protein